MANKIIPDQSEKVLIKGLEKVNTQIQTQADATVLNWVVDEQLKKASTRRRQQFLLSTSNSADLLERHTENCQVLPNRISLLDQLPKDLIVAEVGVAFGKFSEEIWKRMRPRKFHLIDMWESDRFSAGLKIVKQRFNEQLYAGDVVIHQGFSTQMLESFPDGYLDFVYIDTTHAFDLTFKELVESSRKVSERGLIGGHDFCTGNIVTPVVYGVIQACNRFCVEHDWRYKYLTLDTDGHFSFVLERISA
jgi:hypothetical protein